MRDCRELGGVLVKGQRNFSCHLVNSLTADEGPCHDGLPCPLKEQCPYRVQLKKALDSKLVITNYAYWLAQTNYSSGLGDFGLAILDEGHQAFASMENYLTIFLARLDLQPMGINFPESAESWGSWRTWADVSAPVVKDSVAQIEQEIRDCRSKNQLVPNHVSRVYRTTKSIAAKLERLSSVGEDWVIERTYHGYRFIPKWVANYSSHLFKTVPKIVLMSAILSHRTCDYLGVPSNGDRSWVEMDSYFPPENTQIWHIPTARINYHTDDYGATIWCSRIDQIIQRRLDRKGIVFTVSYERAKLLLSRSRFKDIMLTHGTSDVVQVVEKFKRMPAPAVLVSPTVTTGWDFPSSSGVKYLIVGKIPYPDTKDPVTHARHEDDKEWTSYQAMETLVQECGRATRCLSWDTQILTYDGWKGPEDIHDGDLVYSLRDNNLRAGVVNPGGMIVNPVQATHIWNTDKELVHITAKSLDILVTKDHELVILPYGQCKAVSYRYRNWSNRVKSINEGVRAGLKKYRADSLPPRFKVLVSGHVQRERRGSLVCHMSERDDWYFLMGIIISDGYMSKAGSRIRIFQSTSIRKRHICEQIDRVFSRLSLPVTKGVRSTLGSEMSIGEGKHYRRNGDQVYWDLSGYAADRVRRFFAGTPQVRQPITRTYTMNYLTGVEKTIPLWVLQQCRKRELRALLAGLMAGDGTWGKVSGVGTYFTSDKELADRVQYLLVLSDYRSHIRERRGQYEIQFSDNRFVDVPKVNVRTELYEGKTWCVTTEAGTIVTRRNGCVAVVGNSATDTVEVFLIDDSSVWFMKLYAKFAPEWFRNRYRGSLANVPEPLV